VCAQLRGALAWKNAHAGVITADQNAHTRLSEIAVADNHIGITLNFKRGFGDMQHRVYYHNVTVRLCYVMLWCPFYPRERSLCVQVAPCVSV
jgi:hypothetical protein